MSFESGTGGGGGGKWWLNNKPGAPPGKTIPPPGATPPPPPPPGTIGVGTNPVDWQGLIKADPGYIAWKANADKGKANLATNRAAAIKALALQYGGIPKNYQDKYGDLTAADLEAGKNNPYSAEAMIQKNYDQGVLAMKQAAAARGMLQSGELGYGQDQQDQARTKNEYDAGNAFLTALNNALSGYTSGIEGIDSGESGAITAAEGNVIAQNPQPTAITATLTNNWQQYGQPIYESGGKLYDAKGNVFTPPKVDMMPPGWGTVFAPPGETNVGNGPGHDSGGKFWGGY